MRNNIYIILTIALIANTVLAQGAVNITKGEVAPFTGVLITPEIDISIKKDLNELDYLRVIQESNKRVIQAYKNEVVLTTDLADKWRKEAEVQAKARVEAADNTFWRNTGFFTLGALVTIGLTFAVNKASK